MKREIKIKIKIRIKIFESASARHLGEPI